jgi:uncharacterized membrane protein
MRTATMISLAIVLVSFIIGAYLYPSMPAEMASHWNARGEVNGYMEKFWSLFLMPVISLGMLLLFLAVPKMDPLKSNVAKFRKYFDNFVIVIMAFMLYIYMLTILWNLGMAFDISIALSPAFAIIFYYSGVLMEKSKRNWFIGFRTPWTMSSDRVWDKTNKLGGKLFKACGVIALLGVLFPVYAILFAIIPVIVSGIYTFVYSYAEYRKK